jgi:tRNA(fMet)-specific endonuclease VapC
VILYMLDTNICVSLLRGKARDLGRWLEADHMEEMCLSAITLAELQYGIAKSSDPQKDQAAVANFCATIEIVPFDDSAAAVYGQVRAQVERAGRPIGPLDTLIAAHALSMDLTVVTANEREFRRVSGLRVENWPSLLR